ncbi:MAG: hypothetical protein ACE5I1_07255 [bacterium]
MSAKTPTFLLVNPWITDFAAYDFWSKPLGLLYIASVSLMLLSTMMHS